MIATETQLDITFDKAFYHPGEAISIQIAAQNGNQVEATIRSLDRTVTTLILPVTNGVATLNWTAPADVPKGYGLDLRLLDAKGETLTTLSTAFDVLNDWLQAPRYGFLSRFEPGRSNFDQTMQWVTRYHVNGLQYYDWQYRHETLLPPTDDYTDLLDKQMSLSVIKGLIDAGHRYNIASMPYSAIYGASEAFYQQHPDWALFQASGEPFWFGDHYLVIMNPAEGSPWSAHLLNEYANLLDKTDFDGIHIDQYGAPKSGFDSAGQPVKMEDAFPAFINATADVVHAKRGANGATIFNLVTNWPVDTVAPSKEDVVYIEVWEPYRNFLDLHNLVVNAQKLGGGKPVIIAAYIKPEREVNVRLANALIYASGGYYLEFGEPAALLADAYFPKFGIMNKDLETVMAQYSDFMVRYENVLALNTTDATATRGSALTIDGVTTQSDQSRDQVAVIVRQGRDFETFSLVNLMGINTPHWDEHAYTDPTPLTNATVHLKSSKPISHLWLASPDSPDFALQPVTFTTEADNQVSFTLPQLDYWTMLLVDYRS